MKSFEGKVAAVTGAASGIGRVLAFELARRGCALALADLDVAARLDPRVLDKAALDDASYRGAMDRFLQVTTPEQAALQILAGVERNARRVLVGRDAKVLDFWTRVLGSGYQKLVMGKVRRMRRAL